MRQLICIMMTQAVVLSPSLCVLESMPLAAPASSSCSLLRIQNTVTVFLQRGYQLGLFSNINSIQVKLEFIRMMLVCSENQRKIWKNRLLTSSLGARAKRWSPLVNVLTLQLHSFSICEFFCPGFMFPGERLSSDHLPGPWPEDDGHAGGPVKDGVASKEKIEVPLPEERAHWWWMLD